MGMFFVALVPISLDRLPPERVPAASGLSNFLRITAGSFATSLTTTFWDRREALHPTRPAQTATGYPPPFRQTPTPLPGFGLYNQTPPGAAGRAPWGAGLSPLPT